MVFAGRNTLNWSALWRAIAEHRQRLYEYRQDVEYKYQARPYFDNVINRPKEVPKETPEALQVEINAILLNAITRMGTAWQRLLEDRMPILRERLEDFQADDDPSPSIRNSLIDETRVFFQALSEMLRQQGNLAATDVLLLQERLMPYRKRLPQTQGDQ